MVLNLNAGGIVGGNEGAIWHSFHSIISVDAKEPFA